MHLDVILKTVLASAAAMVIAGCGGGGGGGSDEAAVNSVTLSGTAAVGAALADADVTIKCATGGGTGTTGAAGTYSVNMPGAALPCIIQVSGTAGGASITLHSIASAGTTSGADTTAVANVTPVSEMIVAQLTGALPAAAFASFDTEKDKVTSTAIDTAVDAIVAALKTAGIDLGDIDPLQTTLVAANGSNSGNDFDKLLDALGEKVSPEALPQLVNQIANAAGSGSSEGLDAVADAVAGGTLQGCPSVVSGKYRTIHYFGGSAVHEVDFKAKTFGQFTVATDAAKPCEFVATGTVDGAAIQWDVVMGANGAGSYRVRNTSGTNPGQVGYIFPVQTHALADMRGQWDYLQSGFLPGDGLLHIAGKLNVAADNTVPVCEYRDQDFSTCVNDDEANLSIAERSDGGFDLKESSLVVANFYGYRAPNGSITLFGTTNAAGTNTNETEQTHLVATRLAKLALPAVGTTVKYWDMGLTQMGSTRTLTSPAAQSNTVDTVDTAASKVTRTRDDGRQETVVFNQPLDGLRVREAGSHDGVPFAQVIQVPLPGLGITASVNAVPYPSGAHIYNLSVVRP